MANQIETPNLVESKIELFKFDLKADKQQKAFEDIYKKITAIGLLSNPNSPRKKDLRTRLSKIWNSPITWPSGAITTPIWFLFSKGRPDLFDERYCNKIQ